ncbi:MAG: TonB-dependent receptor [Rikenellaceae bacterium]
MKKITAIIVLSILSTVLSFATTHTVKGRVLSASDSTAIEYATIAVEGSALYTLSDSEGNFILSGIEEEEVTLLVKAFGYVDFQITTDSRDVTIKMVTSSLRIDGITVTAEATSKSSGSTSYTIDRTAMEHAQPLSVADLSMLLPGGKSRGDISLVGESGVMSVRSGSGEDGVPTFTTGIEVDGVRISTNANTGTASGSATRSIALSNIQSVEIITGIAPVEYGDISNGIVKINTKKGKSPLNIEVAVRPNTKQFSASKGFSLGENAGIINLSAEHAKSYSDLTSPYTSYSRNALTLNYLKFIELSGGRSLNIDFGSSVNLGGYNDKDDPDKKTNNYTESRDNNFRANLRLDYLPQLSWLTKLEFSSSVSYTDNLYTTNVSESSASSTPALHTTEEGYFIAETYDTNPNADILLLEPGYWYEKSYTDSKPLYVTAKLKATWSKEFSYKIHNNILVGADYSFSKNLGVGLYYDDMRYAPTWREYSYADEPAMNNFSVFVSEDFSMKLTESSSLDVMAGLRSDITYIENSIYGTVANLSPRFNIAYNFLKGNSGALSDVRIYGGWGRGVKLPSFSMLYPTTSYRDIMAFSAASDANNTAIMAYYTLPKAPIYNPDLKWQYTDQTEIGMSGNLWGNKFSLAMYYSVTKNTYTLLNTYIPFAYKLTTQSGMADCPIAFEDRLYDIDQTTGIVTVSDKNGLLDNWTAPYTEYQTYTSDSYYTNGSDVKRWGVEWAVDFVKINPINTSIRLDGNFYTYKSVKDYMVESISSMNMSSGQPYQYVGYYVGSSTVANGSIDKEVNLNLTFNTHIPKIGMIFSVRLESTLYSYSQNLGTEAFAMTAAGSYEDSGADIYSGNNYTAAYPLYYSTWDDPNTLIPFAEKLAWAKTNDQTLYNDLLQLVATSNTDYYFTPYTVTPYFSLNLSITKEIADIGSVSFYATNFLNNISSVTSSWSYGTGTLYNSSYIPQFYYGLTLRLKI